MAVKTRLATWICVKRDGTKVRFDDSKILLALSRCVASARAAGLDVGFSDNEQTSQLQNLCRRVVNSLAATKSASHEVEDVQRQVIAVLWSEGYYTLAESYQSYRDMAARRRAERPLDPDTVRRFAEDSASFPTDLQYYQFISKFSRWKEQERRRETWREAVYERVIPWLKTRPKVTGKLPTSLWDEMSDSMHRLEVSPAMRVVQMAGPALDRCNMGAFNCCAAPLEDLNSVGEGLYILMQGCGYGFSVENEFVEKLPRVGRQKKKPVIKFKVDDSTEGWSDAVKFGFHMWFDGRDVEFDVSGVRPAGSVLKTKGGRSSGPEPLLKLLDFCRKTILFRQGSFLEDIDMHDMMCMAGEATHVGGVRRAALCSLSDLSSRTMRDAKSGNWWKTHMHRSKANNSAVYDFDGPIDIGLFLDEWTSIMKSGSGERGIFNRAAVRRGIKPSRKLVKFLTNPCFEIGLRPYGLCNLSIVVARPNDTYETLRRKVYLATAFGSVQATLTDFSYVRSEWKKNAQEEALLGVDITGHADCPILRYGAPGRAELLRRLAQDQESYMKEFARTLGINEAAAGRCVKPGGDSGVFFDCASGVSPRFSAYQMRWVREGKKSPVSDFLKTSGVPYANAPENPDALYVFGFPKEAPAGCTLRNDMTACEQFKNWLEWKRNWADHSVSVTIYVEPHEWLELGALVYRHIDEVSGIAFLPKDNGVYTYSPNEELTKEQYLKMKDAFPSLNWAKMQHFEQSDMTESAQTVACVGGSCDR